MHDGFKLSSLLIECIMPSYKSLTVTLQMSSASRGWLLKLLLLVPRKEKLSFLGVTVMSAWQGFEGFQSLEDKADISGLPQLFVEILSWHPGRKIYKVRVTHGSTHPYLQKVGELKRESQS